MTTFRVLLTKIFMGLVSAVAADPSADEVAQFHALVQTGAASEVAAALAQNSALATVQDRYGFQAIHVLDYSDFAAKLSLLIDHGADVNARNDQGHALLHILIDPEFVPVVLAAGADPDVRDNEGRTPLMLFLAEADSFDMIAALLGAGADPNARNSAGQTVLAVAKALEVDPEIVDLLVSAGATE
ncbi:ankyrin repeat domain-containing protein [Actibacterium sp. 188UL27-1]|uniref:ankyrin repeat domain-containing protein n=1 Tax=Actibacterium sp. 188UL27-1 TaxID=2786961 RepID=UPI00195D86D6|nr:ankyrin repeat domain-containing protein [Actibacterium sp. 188UL27-1]MBM7068049.1 hypothetical protein [Actibacterium sp. 188UL27-1]